MSDNKSSGGVGIVGVVTIVFVVLKLIKVIDWSWWWVLSPLWISLLLAIAILVIGVGIWVIIKLLFRTSKRKGTNMLKIGSKYKDHEDTIYEITDIINIQNNPYMSQVYYKQLTDSEEFSAGTVFFKTKMDFFEILPPPINKARFTYIGD